LIEEDDSGPVDGGGPFGNISDPDLRELKSLLKDCGISHTTLEEVFMKVTGKKQSKFVQNAVSSVSGPSQVHPVK
jgi:F0F1-type ATP synthase delta subunit